MLTEVVTLHLGTAVLLAALITLNNLGLGGKEVLLRIDGSSLYSLFHCSVPDDDGKNSTGTFWLLLQ